MILPLKLDRSNSAALSGPGNSLDGCPRASLADSLCPGLFSFGLSALPSWPLDENVGCEELKQSILAAINWDELPCRTTEALFKRLKEEIIRLKDEGRVLMRFNELRETLQMRLSGEFKRFADEDLRAVLTLLAGPGAVWAESHFQARQGERQ